MGVDGPEFRPGNAWGHVETAATTLLVGDHEWEVLIGLVRIVALYHRSSTLDQNH
jgi:hypothetical protein